MFLLAMINYDVVFFSFSPFSKISIFHDFLSINRFVSFLENYLNCVLIKLVPSPDECSALHPPFQLQCLHSLAHTTVDPNYINLHRFR